MEVLVQQDKVIMVEKVIMTQRLVQIGVAVVEEQALLVEPQHQAHQEQEEMEHLHILLGVLQLQLVKI
jgi:hypothetical protein